METNIAINNDAPALSGDIALVEDRTAGQPYLFVTAADGANNLLVNRYTIASGTDAINGQNIAMLSSVTGNLITVYNNNTYLTAGQDNDLYHWQEGDFVDFEPVSNTLTDILPQLSVKTGQSATGPVIQYVTRHLGDKYYELKDHPPGVGQALGNPDKSGQAVRAAISDLRTMQEGIAQASVESYNNYYPFGMLMPGRNGFSEGYRYGFQGQEMDNEQKGVGNMVDYKFRMLDSRIGRFFSVDPLTAKYPHYTPYSFSGNRVVDAFELEGLEEIKINEETGDYYDVRHGKGTVSCFMAPTMGYDGWDKHMPQYWPDYRAPKEVKYMAIGIVASPLILLALPEISLIAGTSWGSLPAVSTYLSSAGSVGAGSLGAYSYLVGAGGDYIGQVGGNLIGGGGWSSFYRGVNFTSVGVSGLNPSNNLRTLFFNGVVSNGLNIGTNGLHVGGFSEMLLGGGLESMTGGLFGKLEAGVLFKQGALRADIELSINNIKQLKSYNYFGGNIPKLSVGGYRKAGLSLSRHTSSTYLGAMNLKLQVNRNLLRFLNVTQYSGLIGGQTYKSTTYNNSPKPKWIPELPEIND